MQEWSDVGSVNEKKEKFASTDISVKWLFWKKYEL